MPTLNDIAQKANVSISTVSRCLRKDAKLSINSETRKRIFLIAHDLGYRNPSIESVQLNTIVIHKDSHFVSNIDNGYYYDVRAGIEEETSFYGDACRFVPVSQLENEKSQFDSVIIVGNYSPKQIDFIKGITARAQKVFVGKLNFMPEAIDTISYDVHSCVDMALQRLLDSGLSKFIFIDGVDKCGIPAFYHKIFSVNEFIERNPSMKLVSYLECPEFGSSQGYQTMKEYIEKGGVVPEAVFAANDPLAIGAMKALNEKNYGIGSQVSVISINGDDSGEWTNPRLTSISLQSRLMGKEAVKILHYRVENPESIPRFTVFQPVLIERDSVKRNLFPDCM